MLTIKSIILRIWDTAATGIRICCIKFAQQVVLAQTTGPESEQRVQLVQDISGTLANDLPTQRDGYVEMSLSLVPENHPLIPSRKLEAEASGLLDRLLEIFQESAMYVTSSRAYRHLLTTAEIRSLSMLL